MENDNLYECPFCGIKEHPLANSLMGYHSDECFLRRFALFAIKVPGDIAMPQIVETWNHRTESAWEMFRRLIEKYQSDFINKLIPGNCGVDEKVSMFLDNNEKEAIAIMKEREKELKGALDAK